MKVSSDLQQSILLAVLLAITSIGVILVMTFAGNL